MYANGSENDNDYRIFFFKIQKLVNIDNQKVSKRAKILNMRYNSVNFLLFGLQASVRPPPMVVWLQGFRRCVSGAAAACQREGIKFLPLVVETLGGRHHVGEREVRRLVAAKARNTGTVGRRKSRP